MRADGGRACRASLSRIMPRRKRGTHSGDDGGPHLQSVSSLRATLANIETRCFCISILSSAIEFFLDGLIRQLAHAKRMQSQTDDRISIRV